MAGDDDSPGSVPSYGDYSDYTEPNWFFSWNASRPWRRAARTIINQVRHPAYSAYFRRYVPLTVAKCQPSLVLSGVGVPREHGRRGIARLATETNRLLIAGCGDGASVGEWLRLRPRETIAVDIYRFDRAWTEIQQRIAREGYRIDFFQADLAVLASILPDNWADVVVSESVFEHCKEMPAVLSELTRVLRPGGVLYASYGPMWYAAGGDHFSGRGGLHSAYNHLLLPPEQYRAYFETYVEAQEPVQDGGRYVALDLFSKMAPREYLALFEQCGYRREDLVVQVCRTALKFRRAFPDRWRELQQHFPHLWQEEFLLKAHWIWLRRRG